MRTKIRRKAADAVRMDLGLQNIGVDDYLSIPRDGALTMNPDAARTYNHSLADTYS